MAEKGMPVGELNLDTLDYSELDAELKKHFGIGKEVIKKTFHPYVYLDRELIQKQKQKLEDVSQLVAKELIEIDGIAYAIPSTDLATGRMPDASPMAR